MGKKDFKGKAPENISLNASKQKEFNQKVHKIKRRKKIVGSSAGVVYVSHLPWGFEEKPLKKYFSQFGSIKQMRVSRSKKTGNTRGYAYIQFAHDEVAKIVAESMNNYLMFGKLIKCRHLTNPHPDTFRNAHRKFIKTPTFLEHAVVKHNSKKSDEAVEKSQNRILGKLAKLQATLAGKGITYTLDDENLQATMKKLKEKKKAKKEERQKEKKENMNEEESEENDSEEEELSDVIVDEDDDDDDDDDDDESSDDDDDFIEKEAVEVSDDYISGDEDDDDKDTDDGDDDDEIEFTKTKSSPALKKGKVGKPGTPSGRPMSVEKKSLKTVGTPKRLSIIPKEVDTPKGKMNVLIEDSSDEEITFRTPPMSIKSSKLDESMKITTKSPKTPEDTSPKRKQKDKTPHTGAKKVKVSGEGESTGKKSEVKVKVSPKIEVGSEVQDEIVDTQENLSSKGSNLRKQSGTPKTVVKTPHQTPGRKTPKSNRKQIKTPPSQAKFKGLKK